MRIATQADRPVLNDLWQQAFGDEPEFSNFVFDKFAGFDHTYVEEQSGQIVALACAVPVTLGELRGFYLYGLNTRAELRGKGIMRALLQALEQQLAGGGAAFTVLVPANEPLFGFYEKLGYETLVTHRIVKKEVKPNLWVKADFDTLTAPRLAAARAQFLPRPYVSFATQPHAAMVQNLYTSGATTVQTEQGYGVFFVQHDTMVFRELAAESNFAATQILEAARQKSSCFEATIELPHFGELFLGEGEQRPYGMLKWLAEKRLTEELTMSLMCD